LSLNATHPSNNLTEFDLHNLFSLAQTKATFEYLNNETIGGSPATNRTFLISRGTAPGSGKFAGHWMGDNHKSWKSMKHSIASVMNF